MADEIAGFAVGLSERLRYPIKAAFRQALEAGVRYGYMTRNPAKLAGPNPMPAPREIRVYTAAELKAVTDELGTVARRRCDVRGRYRAQTLGVGVDRAERRRQGAAKWSMVRGTKTLRSRREVPLTSAALTALDTVPPAGQPLRVHDVADVPGEGRAGAVRCRELPAARVGAGDRRRRDREARTHLRPTRRRSPRTRSRPGSPCSSSPGSWAPARR